MGIKVFKIKKIYIMEFSVREEIYTSFHFKNQKKEFIIKLIVMYFLILIFFSQYRKKNATLKWLQKPRSPNFGVLRACTPKKHGRSIMKRTATNGAGKL